MEPGPDMALRLWHVFLEIVRNSLGARLKRDILMGIGKIGNHDSAGFRLPANPTPGASTPVNDLRSGPEAAIHSASLSALILRP